MASFAIRMVALQAPINGIVRSRITYLQAIGRTRNMQALTFVSSLVYVVGCAFALGALFGADGGALSQGDFYLLEPDSANPYKRLYTNN